MSALVARTVPLEIGGTVFHLKFTLRTLCDLQDRFGEIGGINYLDPDTVKTVLSVITGASPVALQLPDDCTPVSSALITAFLLSMPDPPENNAPPAKREAPVDEWIFQGVLILKLPLNEVLELTLRQLSALIDKYMEYHGVQPKRELTIDDIIPI